MKGRKCVTNKQTSKTHTIHRHPQNGIGGITGSEPPKRPQGCLGTPGGGHPIHFWGECSALGYDRTSMDPIYKMRIWKQIRPHFRSSEDAFRLHSGGKKFQAKDGLENFEKGT